MLEIHNIRMTLAIMPHYDYTIVILTRNRKRFTTNCCLRLFLCIMTILKDVEAGAFPSIFNRLPQIQIFKFTMSGEKISNTPLFLNEFTN